MVRSAGRRTPGACRVTPSAGKPARVGEGSCDLNRCLREVVASKLQEDWSPEQISGWLKRRYPLDEAMHISHQSIYRTLFIQARGALEKELLAHLRSGRTMRHSRKASTAKSWTPGPTTRKKVCKK